ncbi:MAG: DoxX family protein [Planctomycetota bacterium]
MFHRLVATSGGVSSLVLRLGLGIVMLPHGAQKVLGVWGGHGFSATLDHFTGGMGTPLPLALLAIAAEFLGSLGLVVGFLGRVAALGIGVTMAVAAVMAHLGNGFFMNWAGQQKGEGFEYHILAVAIALGLVLRGSGSLSIDRWLQAKRG